MYMYIHIHLKYSNTLFGGKCQKGGRTNMYIFALPIDESTIRTVLKEGLDFDLTNLRIRWISVYKAFHRIWWKQTNGLVEFM